MKRKEAVRGEVGVAASLAAEAVTVVKIFTRPVGEPSVLTRESVFQEAIHQTSSLAEAGSGLENRTLKLVQNGNARHPLLNETTSHRLIAEGCAQLQHLRDDIARTHRGRARDGRLAGWAAIAAVVLGVVLGACSGGDENNNPSEGVAIGAEGGEFSTADGVVTVRIPPGAVATTTTFTIEPIVDPVPGFVGAAVEIGPTGTVFSAPVTIEIRYDEAGLGGLSPEKLAVSTVVGGRWESVSAPALDSAARTIAGVTYHLSPYALAQIITPGQGLPDGYTPCAWRVNQGDFCTERAERCGYWTNGTESDEMVLAYCEGNPSIMLNWATARRSASCPVSSPRIGGACGTFYQSCQYFSGDVGDTLSDAFASDAACVTTCHCGAEGWDCVNNCSCRELGEDASYGETGQVPATQTCPPTSVTECRKNMSFSPDEGATMVSGTVLYRCNSRGTYDATCTGAACEYSGYAL